MRFRCKSTPFARNSISILRTDLGDSIKDLQDEVTRLQGLVQAAADKDRMEQEEAARMAAAKTGKELFMALAGPTENENALDRITSTDLDSSGLMINDITSRLKAGGSAGSLGSWSGMNYAYTDAAAKMMNEAVVYTNKGPGRMQSFKDLAAAENGEGYMVQAADVGNEHFKGYISLGTGVNIDSAVLRRIGGDAFMHSGQQTHSYVAADGAFTTRGTYDGAPGEYRCSDTCSSTNDGKGGPSALGGTWHFKPDAGANAMAHRPDADYLYYGWWVSKNDGMPTAASAFTDAEGTLATALSGSNTPDMLTGSAMYAGHAAGKFALDYSKNKLLDGASDGGHFTADVMLSATFGGGSPTPTNPGISGTIDNFMANGESVPWSVELKRAGWDSGAATFGVTGDDAMTVWSIDGTPAPASGGWSGQMYDEMPPQAPRTTAATSRPR